MISEEIEEGLSELVYEHNGYSVLIKDTRLIKLRNDFDQTTKEDELKNYIKQVVDICKLHDSEKLDNHEAKYAFIEMFAKCHLKKVLRKYFIDIITSHTNLFLATLSSTRDEILVNIKNKTCYPQLCNDLILFAQLGEDISVLQDKVVEYMFPVCYVLFGAFSYNPSSNLEHYMSLILKKILFWLPKLKNYPQFEWKHYIAKIITFAHAVLAEKSDYTLKVMCGLIVVSSFNNFPKICRKKCKYKSCPALELIADYNNDQSVTLAKCKLNVLKESDSISTIYTSILNMFPQQKLREVEIKGKVLIFIIYNGLTECAKSKPSEPNVIAEISGNLGTALEHLTVFPIELTVPLFLDGIDHISSHIDHPVVTVRNYTKKLFSDMIKFASQYEKNGCNKLMAILAEYVTKLPKRHITRFLAMEYVSEHLGVEYLFMNYNDVLEVLLKGIEDATLSEQVCKTYISMMEKHFTEVENDKWISIWIVPIRTLFTKCVEFTSVCHKIIIKAFHINPNILKLLWPKEIVGNSQEIGILLKCVHHARLNGIKLNLTEGDFDDSNWRELIPKYILEKCAVHQDEEIRVTVLAVIVETQKSTETFLDWELTYLREYIRYNVTCQIPNFRKQIIAYYKKALTRHSAGYNATKKRFSGVTKTMETLNNRELEELQQVYKLLNYYENFIEAFTVQIISYLRTDANHFRICTALDLLISIQQLLCPKVWHKCWCSYDVQNCIKILYDTYESNKKMAMTLLKSLPPALLEFKSPEDTLAFMEQALTMATDLKPSKTLTAAYLLELCSYSPYFMDVIRNKLCQKHEYNDPKFYIIIILIDKLTKLRIHIDDTFEVNKPSYGLFFSVTYILQNTNIMRDIDKCPELFKKLTIICKYHSKYIMPVVCSPAPEGFLPSDEENLCDNDPSAKAQKLLCVSWRTIKEISLLLATIVKRAIKLEDNIELLPDDMLKDIGMLFYNIFVEAKHKGVFENAYVGFSAICESFRVSKIESLHKFPEEVLKDAVSLCIGTSAHLKLNPTRRSAGLPFLIVSVLCSETTHNRPNFNQTIKVLLEACKLTSTGEVTKMHCLNVLRMIFKQSKLGEVVSAYITNAVIVTIISFKSNSWGVRNSATLLFTSLITRIFGVQKTQDSENLRVKNKLGISVFVSRYPNLLSFLLKTLSDESEKQNSLVIHPILIILGRLYPTYFKDYNIQIVDHLQLTMKSLSNPFYRTRRLAPSAVLSLVPIDRIDSFIIDIFKQINSPDISDNHCQGLLLLALQFILTHKILIPVTECLENSIHLLEHVGVKFSHMTVTIYMTLIYQLLRKYKNYDDIDMLKKIMILLSRQMSSKLIAITSKHDFHKMKLLLILSIAINKFEECELTYPTIGNQIIYLLRDENMAMRRFCLMILIYMNEVIDKRVEKHALFQMCELSIDSEIVILVDTFEKPNIRKILQEVHPYLKHFLSEELKCQRNATKGDQVFLFLLLRHYPCVMKHFNETQQRTLELLISFCYCQNEPVISVVISCLSVFLQNVDYSTLNYKNLIQILMESASPAASVYRRLALCELLVNNYLLYCNENPDVKVEEQEMLFNVVMILLEDEELLVRNAMSKYATTIKVKLLLKELDNEPPSIHQWPVSAERAKEILLNLCTILLPRQRAICYIFSWACRYFPDNGEDTSQVFERSEINLYADNVMILNLCTYFLLNLLWNVQDGPYYESKSTYLEEKTLLMTKDLLDALVNCPSPMMLKESKIAVICALKSIINHIEKYRMNSNFVDDFRVYIDKSIVTYLNKVLKSNDKSLIMKVVTNLYEKTLNVNKIK